jgi:regulator of cell morphogenesis and NO signaling
MPSQLQLTRTVGNIVRERIGAARVFERFGIDYCCGGDVPLEAACRQSGVGVDEVCTALEEEASALPEAGEPDWATLSLTELADDIVARHHTWLRSELPRLGGLIDRVLDAHGANHPELNELRDVFAALQNELYSHMMKEERVLFPIIRQLEEARAQGLGSIQFHCGSVNNPIRVMEHEHDDAGAALRRMRELTGGFQPPEDACESYRALLAGLQDLETDLHLHIHKENNILFPGAADLEAELSGTG